jgi:hypothetical protein
MANAARAQAWSRVASIAWIAFRSFAAVRAAEKIEREARDPLRRLVMYAAADEFRQQTTKSPQAAVALAVDEFERARRAKRLIPDAKGHYRAKSIKALFPSSEGRGKGQAKQKTDLWAGKTRILAWQFLTTAKSMDWAEHFYWCRDEGLLRTRGQYERLRPAALRYAEDELASRIRADIGIHNARGPLSAEEAAACKANIRSWKQRGRPRNAIAIGLNTF